LNFKCWLSLFTFPSAWRLVEYICAIFFLSSSACRRIDLDSAFRYQTARGKKLVFAPLPPAPYITSACILCSRIAKYVASAPALLHNKMSAILLCRLEFTVHSANTNLTQNPTACHAAFFQQQDRVPFIPCICRFQIAPLLHRQSRKLLRKTAHRTTELFVTVCHFGIICQNQAKEPVDRLLVKACPHTKKACYHKH
jgi:hypothetical protein